MMTQRSLFVSCVIVLCFLVSACGMAAKASPSPAPPTAQPVVETVVVVVTATPLSTPILPPPNSDAQSLLVCQTETIASQCTAPEGEVRSKFCVEKKPYVLLAFPQGTTFQPMTPSFFCTDEGVHGGDQMVSCYGPEMTTFDLQICDSTCTGSAFEQGDCPDGYGFDATQQCCVVLPDTPPGCRIIQVAIGACPLPH